MKNTLIKIISSIVVLALLGLGVYYFLSHNAQNTISKNNTESTQPGVEYKENNTELSLVVDGKSRQTLSLDADALESLSFAPNAKKFITDLDVNFDGQNDVGVFQSTGYAGVNDYYDFYIYNSETKMLDKSPELSEISNPTVDVLGRINNVVISTYRSGPMWYSDIYFHYDDGQGGDTYVKEVAQDSNPDMEFQYYAHQPTRTLPDMPLKNIFTSIVDDTEVDISISKSDYEWGIYIIEKNKNKYKGEKVMGPVYTDDVLYLSIKTKLDWNKEVENEKKDVERFDVGSMEVKQEIFNGVTWNYYDFFDGYDGGYLRTYFVEKDGYVLSFAIANEVIEDNADISLTSKVKFLKKLDLK